MVLEVVVVVVENERDCRNSFTDKIITVDSIL